MDINVWSPSVLAIIIVIISMIYVLGFGDKMKPKSRKKSGIIFGFIGVVALIVLLAGASLPAELKVLNDPLWGGLGKTATIGTTNIIYSATGTSGSGTTPLAGTCPVQETASYTAKDKFSSSVIGGTSYYKTNGLPATTSATTNLNRGTQYTYWVSNTTSYVTPKVLTADCGVNTFVADVYQNASATVSGYDTVNSKATNNGEYNISMSANAQGNLRITYQGTAKKSAMPFGGLMVFDYNNTIASITCTGDVLLGSNPFHLTYSPSLTTHTYQMFALSSGIDDGTGSPKVINCQILNGASSAGAESPYYVKFYGANYYVTNNGDIVLDTEKFANQDNTKTGLAVPSLLGYWGA